MSPFTLLKQGRTIPLGTEYTVRLIRSDDVNDLIAMLDNPNVAEYLFFAPAPEEVYRAYFESMITDTEESIATATWPESPTVIVRDQQGRFMGMGGLAQVLMLEGNYDVGYQLPEYAWGKGIATVLCHFLTTLGFEALGAHKLAADCYSRNVGSYKTLEKCGYLKEGCSPAYYKLENGFDDRLYYGLSQADYHNLKTDGFR